MSDTAQTKSPLMQRMRGAFQQQAVQSVQPAQQQPTQVTNQSDLVQQQVQEQQLPVQAPQVTPQQPVILSTEQKLDALDTVLTSIEQQQPTQVPQVNPQQPIQARQQNMGMVAQATPVAVDQVVQEQQQLQAAQAGGGVGKETIVGGGVDTGAVEAAATIQYVEQEQSPEISPEVAGYLQHVEDLTNQEPQEYVVGEEQQQQPLPTNYQKQAVVVLPITPDVEKKGSRKGPLESVRWLVEWSRKLMKMFSGEIIYREVEQ